MENVDIEYICSKLPEPDKCGNRHFEKVMVDIGITYMQRIKIKDLLNDIGYKHIKSVSSAMDVEITVKGPCGVLCGSANIVREVLEKAGYFVVVEDIHDDIHGINKCKKANGDNITLVIEGTPWPG